MANKDHCHFFALGSDGLLHSLGEHADIETADQTASKKGLQSVWLFDETTAKSWFQFLQDRLIELRAFNDIALPDADYLLRDGSAWFTVKGFSVRVGACDEGVVADIYTLGRETDSLLGSTWALDSEVMEENHD